MKDLVLLTYYLGIEVKQEHDQIMLKQAAYGKKILKLAGMSHSNPSRYPMEARL